jgi:hypothetical protein
MFPPPFAARRPLTEPEVDTLLRQPRSPYRPLPTDPRHDPAKPPEPGALAWMLAHELSGDEFRLGMDVWIEAAEGRVDNDPGLCQAWAHARQHAAGNANEVSAPPCFAVPVTIQPVPATQALSDRLSNGFTVQPATGLTRPEKMLTHLRMSLAQVFMHSLGMHRPEPGASSKDIDRLLRQGVAMGFLLDLPLGGQVPAYLRGQARTAGTSSPQYLFGQDTMALRANLQQVGNTFMETFTRLGTTCPRPAEFGLGMAAFKQYLDECDDRICKLGRSGTPYFSSRHHGSGVETGV